jgi:hypothetical protein
LIVVGCGYGCPLAGAWIKGSIDLMDLYLCNMIAYAAIGLAIYLTFSKINFSLGRKLVGTDVFGRYEYILGMLSGVLRYACIAITLLAMFNARIVPAAQRERDRHVQEVDANGVHLPRWGSIQQHVLFESYSGQWARHYLRTFLIDTPATAEKTRETPGARRQKEIENLMAPSTNR